MKELYNELSWKYTYSANTWFKLFVVSGLVYWEDAAHSNAWGGGRHPWCKRSRSRWPVAEWQCNSVTLWIQIVRSNVSKAGVGTLRLKWPIPEWIVLSFTISCYLARSGIIGYWIFAGSKIRMFDGLKNLVIVLISLPPLVSRQEEPGHSPYLLATPGLLWGRTWS